MPKLPAEEKKAYLKRKERLIEFEKTNFDRIVFLKATRGFFVVGGNSAILLVHKIAPELKMRVLVRRDDDYDVRFENGIVSAKNLDYYKRELAKSVYLLPPVEEENSLVFPFRKKVTKTEFNLLKKSKEIKKKGLERRILKSVPFPNLHIALSDLLSLVYRLYVKNTDKLAKEFVVARFLNEIREADKVLLLICREEYDIRKGFSRISTSLNLALCDLDQILSLEIWSVENCTAVSGAILNVFDELELERKRNFGK
ncbi:hypothetical protein IJ380_01760 [Candidatus Saccharibacteria bacterium]|nr:hypothetical protein [Candidatus Saccharibacteria bacterium]